MKKHFLTICFLMLTINFISAQEAKEELVLTDVDKIVGLSKLWATVKYNYVYYDQLTFNWDSLYEASIPKVLSIKDPFEYCRELQRITVMLNDGHTKVFPTINTRGDDDLISPAPLTTKLFNKKIYIHKIFSTALKDQGFEQGLEITRINGENAYEYAVKNVLPYTSSSTPQWTEYAAFCSLDLTKGRKGDPMKIEFKDKKGKLTEVVIDKYGKWDAKEETFAYSTLPNNIGLLLITTFWGNDFNEKFDKIYEDIKNTDALIIDLRDNGGGNTGFGNYILSHLSNKPIKSSQWSSRMYIPSNVAWGNPDEWYLQSPYTVSPIKKEIYTKPIVVLINSGTFSAAEDFTIMFKGANRGKLIGTATGGSTGNPIFVKLIDGVANAMVCTKKDVAPDGTIFVGVGIKPDIEIRETVESFLGNKDLVLQEAIRQIQTTKK